MAIVLPKENDFEMTPAGTHVAICYRVIDLGTQEVDFQGKLKHQRKIMISWELPQELMETGEPFSVHKKFTLSGSKKGTLRKFLESWRGTAFTDKDFGTFDIGNLIGKPALVGIIHEQGSDGGTYANITSVMKIAKGTPIPEPVNEKVYFSLSEFDLATFEKLSDNLKGIIQKSPEYKQFSGGGQTVVVPVSEDTLPF
jgi:hypothetical protein